MKESQHAPSSANTPDPISYQSSPCTSTPSRRRPHRGQQMVQNFLTAAEAEAASISAPAVGEIAHEEVQPLGRREEQVNRRRNDRVEPSWMQWGTRPSIRKSDRRDAAQREGREEGGSGDSWRGEGWNGGLRGLGGTWWALAIFVHEVWLCLQHANVLLNPFCQRLDRGYGIALLKRRLYWVIATVLAAYWAREVLSMLLAAPYASPLSRKMIAVSSVYHVVKILLVSLDASRGWSPTLGIMRLLIDHWHFCSFKDLLLSIKRFSLQGFDTATHALVVLDMLRWDEEKSLGPQLGFRHTLFLVSIVWTLHAVGNIVTKKSTATLIVEVAKRFVRAWGHGSGSHGVSKSSGVGDGGSAFYGGLEGGRADFVCTSSCSHGHKLCEVCYLLTRDKPPSVPVGPSRRKRVD